MTDLGREIVAAVRADWSDSRLEAARAGVHRRERQRRARIRAALVAGTVLAVAGGSWAAVVRSTAPAGASVAQPFAPFAVQLADGATALAIGAASRVRAVAVAPPRVAVEVAQGAAWFDVPPASSRVLAAVAGPVTVEAADAIFACERTGAGARVDVFRGTVVVRAGGDERHLAAGESAELPAAAPPVAPVAPSTVPVDATAPPAHAAPPARRRISAAVPASPDWRDLARDGDYDGAYAALHRGGATAHDDVAELLLAADVARLSHHASEAVAPLRQVLRGHASDPRASLGAFTLGRVLLDGFGSPREAATAFADAIRLAPDGPLAEDALAREVEALSRAGDVTAAHARAAEYVARFPEGRKVRAVRRFGGLE